MSKNICKLTIIITLILLFANIPNTHSTIITQNFQEINKKNEIKINPKIDEIIDKINYTLVKDFLYKLISFGPRMTSTHGCKITGDYIYNKFKEFGLDAEKRPWSGFGNRWNKGYYKSYNIVGTKNGTDKDDEEVIIFHSHYDTVKDSVGANDDGSGVVGVLTAAYILTQYDFNKTIKFVTFSGEEIGLLGSTYYAKEIYNENLDLLVGINADMIGKSISKEDGKKIRLSYSEDTDWIIDYMEAINKSNDKLNLKISAKYPYDRDSKNGYSDYFGLIQCGYESISVWEQCGDPFANTPQDVLSNVNISYLVNTTRMITATIAQLADINDQPPKITISTPRKGKIYYEDKIIKNLDSFNTFVFNDIWIYTDINIYDSKIDRVEFYYDGKLEIIKEEIPYVWHLNKNSFGKHNIEVKLYDDQGRNSTDQINIFYINLLKSK